MLYAGPRGADVRPGDVPAATVPEPVRTPEFFFRERPHRRRRYRAAPVRLNIHRACSATRAGAVQSAPESHLLDLSNSHENTGGRVPHAAHAPESSANAAAAAHGGGDQPFTGGRQDLFRGQPGAGAVSLAENSVLLGDFDLRRPIVHNLFQIDRAPGLSDYLTGQCTFPQALRRIEGMNLYVLPAGTPVKNLSNC